MKRGILDLATACPRSLLHAHTGAPVDSRMWAVNCYQPPHAFQPMPGVEYPGAWPLLKRKWAPLTPTVKANEIRQSGTLLITKFVL